jgi:hypothetical protein
MSEEAIPSSDEITVVKSSRIQYSEDVEAGLRRERLQRRGSNASEISTYSMGRKTVDPASLIPIEYRTV